MAKHLRMLTTGEIAKYCNVSFITVIRWIDKGRLKGYQLPGRGDRRVSETDFIEFLKTNNMPVPDDFIQEEENRRVLIVDDDEAIARAINLILQQAGFEIEIATDGFTAGRLLESFRPAVMTLDLKMPGVPGIKVLKNIKSSKELADTNVIVVSGMPLEVLDEAVSYGADGYIRKPFKADELLEKVKSYFEPAAVS
ncbi:MAG: response regulator [Planctomycetota bacterium]|jgi:excisionase family DNA binding protein